MSEGPRIRQSTTRAAAAAGVFVFRLVFRSLSPLPSSSLIPLSFTRKRTKVVGTSQVLDNGRHGGDEIDEIAEEKEIRGRAEGEEKRKRSSSASKKRRFVKPRREAVALRRLPPLSRRSSLSTLSLPTLFNPPAREESLKPRSPPTSPVPSARKNLSLDYKPRRESIGPGGPRTRNSFFQPKRTESRSTARRRRRISPQKLLPPLLLSFHLAPPPHHTHTHAHTPPPAPPPALPPPLRPPRARPASCPRTGPCP